MTRIVEQPKPEHEAVEQVKRALEHTGEKRPDPTRRSTFGTAEAITSLAALLDLAEQFFDARAWAMNTGDASAYRLGERIARIAPSRARVARDLAALAQVENATVYICAVRGAEWTLHDYLPTCANHKLGF